MADELFEDFGGALDRVSIPAYVVDSAGVVRWVNRAGRAIVGDVRGRQITSLVVPDEARRAREMFARKMLGTTEVTDFESTIVRADGGVASVQVSSVPLYNGDRVVGVFGQVSRVEEPEDVSAEFSLTPRQAEVLRMLARGSSTDEIAAELHVSRETVRNHVRHLLRALDVRSRLEAVALVHGGGGRARAAIDG